MPFTIPNEADAANANQAEPDKVDIDILVAGAKGDGVVSGCAVTEDSPQSTNVAVASGEVIVAGAQATVAAGDVDCGAAHGSLPRFDLIAVNSSGTKSAVNGTANANPVFPAIPANSVIIAAVYRAATDDTIADADIVDKRLFPTTSQAQTVEALWTFNAGVKLAASQAIKDSGGTDRIVLATSSPHVTLKNNVQVDGVMGLKGTVPSERELLKISPTMATPAGDHLTLIDMQPILTLNASAMTITGVVGVPAVRPDGSYSSVIMRGLYFAGSIIDTDMSNDTVDVTEMTGLFAGVSVIGLTAGNTLTVGVLRGLYVTLAASYAAASGGVNNARGIELSDPNSTKIVNYTGIKIDDENAATGNIYLLEIGPTVPYLRCLGGMGAVLNQTALYIAHGNAGPVWGLRQLRTMDPGVDGGNFAGGELVCILV